MPVLIQNITAGSPETQSEQITADWIYALSIWYNPGLPKTCKYTLVLRPGWTQRRNGPIQILFFNMPEDVILTNKRAKC